MRQPQRGGTLGRGLLAALAILTLAAAGLVPAAARPAAQAGGPELAVAGRVQFLPLLFFDQAPAPPPPPSDPAVSVTLRPVPLEQVQRGNVLSLEYRVLNEDASRPVPNKTLEVYYNSNLISYQGANVAPGDGVASVDFEKVRVVVFNVAPGEQRTGRLNFLVPRSVAPGSVIQTFARFLCRNNAEFCLSNTTATQVVINDDENNNTGGTFAMNVSPDRGGPGTVFRFSGSFYIPGEEVVTWLNSTSGITPLPIVVRASSAGTIAFEFSSGGLADGYYSLVAHGRTSNTEGVGPFIVGNPPARLVAELVAEAGADQPLGVSALAGPAVGADATAGPAQAGGSGGIGGRVTAADSGQGLVGVEVAAIDGGGRIIATTSSTLNGAYFFASGLSSGQYSLRFRPSQAPAAAVRAYVDTLRPAPVTVVEPELTANVNIALPRGGAVSGQARSTGALADVLVLARDQAGDVVATARSDAQGVYALTGLPLGASYDIEFDPAYAADGRVATFAGSVVEGVAVNSTSPVTVNSPLAARAARGGVISGRVTGANDGQGLADVLVVISSADGSLASVVDTLPSGDYVSEPLPAGSYSVAFLTLYSSSPRTLTYQREYYDDSSTAAGADPVTIPVGGGTVAGIDAALAPGGAISGRVTAAAGGAGIPGVVVTAFDGSGRKAGYAVSAADGSYSIGGLPAGGYRVGFLTGSSAVQATRSYFSAYYNGKPSLAAADPVTVAVGQTAQNISAALAQGGQIRGRVTGAGLPADSNGLAGVSVSIYDAGGNPVAIAQTDAGGNYATDGLASGTYRVRFSTTFALGQAAQAYIDEWHSNKGDIGSADPVTVTAPNVAGNINAELARGGLIRGRVTAADSGAGLAHVLVYAYDGAGQVAGLALSGDDGVYSIPGLAAGSYRLSFITAVAPEPEVRAYQSEFYNDKPDLASADPVTVTAGAATEDIDAALAP